VGNVLLAYVATFLIIVVFVGTNEHFKVIDFLGGVDALHQLLDLSNFREHVYNLAQIVFR